MLAAQSSGSISTATAAKELRQSSETTGVFSNITDEDIAALARRFDERCRVVMMLRSYVTALYLPARTRSNTMPRNSRGPLHMPVRSCWTTSSAALSCCAVMILVRLPDQRT